MSRQITTSDFLNGLSKKGVFEFTELLAGSRSPDKALYLAASFSGFQDGRIVGGRIRFRVEVNTQSRPTVSTKR